VPRPADRAARVLVVGDSLGQSLAAALAEAGDARGIEVASRAAAGCTLDVERTMFQDGREMSHEDEMCPELVLRWGDDVARFQPDAVLVLYGAVWSDWVLDGRRRGSCDPEFQRHYGELVDHAIVTLSSRGGRVVVAPPSYARTYGTIADHDALTDCQRGIYTDAVARHADRAALVRADLTVCPSPSTCDTQEGMRRYDGLHFRGDDAAIIAGWLLDQVLLPSALVGGGE
jgi:SGNH domain (fused to AT3 domains)